MTAGCSTISRLHIDRSTQNIPIYCSPFLCRLLFLTPESRLRFGVALVTGRPAVERQLAPLKQLYESELAHFRKQREAARQVASDPLGPLPAGADVAELAAWTLVASVLLNLDAVLTKG